MSSTTKKKHVCREVLDDYVLPSGNQEIVRVAASRGNNLHEVVDAKGKSFLVSMPTKFRKSVWIKRGNFVIVEPIEEGDKVQAEIIVILYRDQIRYIKRENQWPAAFDSSNDSIIETSPSPFPSGSSSDVSDERQQSSSPAPPVVVVDDDDGKKLSSGGVPSDMMPPSDSEDEDYDSDEEFLVVNPNRPQAAAPVDESSSEEDDSSEEEEEEEEKDEKRSETGKGESSVIEESMKRCIVISTQG